MGLVDGPNLFRYSCNSPVVLDDSNGMEPLDTRTFESSEEFVAASPAPYSNEYLAQVWKAERFSNQDWTDRALAKAGIDTEQWRPSEGFPKNAEIVLKVYAYYADLYNQRNELRWAAMAKLAGGEVLRGFNILERTITNYEMHMSTRTGDLGEKGFLGSLGAQAGFAQDLSEKLLEMQKDIFFDLAWQHQAYLEGGLPALEAANKRGELSNKLLAFPISEFGLCSCGFLGHPL